MTTKVNLGLIDGTLGPRNVIINGNFDVWQRGTTFAAIPTGDYSADRFKYAKIGTMVHTISRSTDVPTYTQSGTLSNYSLQLDVTTADTSIATGDYSYIGYRVEGYDYARIAGGDATLSFWVKAAKTGIHCVALRNSANDRSYIREYTVATADTWEKHTVTLPLTETGGTWDYINGLGLQVLFMLAVGATFHNTKDAWQTGNYMGTANQVNEVDSTANNFHIAQVQFEKGSIATPFEIKLYTDELARCQRYYWRGNAPDTAGHRYGTAGAGTMFAGVVQFPTTLRDPPTVSTITSPTLTNCTSPVIAQTGLDGMVLRVSVTAAGVYRAINGVYDADAEL